MYIIICFILHYIFKSNFEAGRLQADISIWLQRSCPSNVSLNMLSGQLSEILEKINFTSTLILI